jgi:hypothetical protein
MLISTLAISSASRVCRISAAALPQKTRSQSLRAIPASKVRLDIDIAHLARRIDGPALDGAEMEILPRRILGSPFGVRLLHLPFSSVVRLISVTG